MARLSRSDLEDVVDFAGEVAVAAREAERFDTPLLEHIGRSVRADVVAYSHFDAAHRIHEDTVVGDVDEPPMTDELWDALMTENPYTLYARRIRQPYLFATRLNDIIDRESFRQTRLYQLTAGIEAPAVQMRMPGSGRSSWAFEVVRYGREFSDRDLALLDAIRPWLIHHEDVRTLANQVARIRSVPVERLRDARLTVRENQVLDRLADGASNQDIADALGISPETVRKHLENIYAKLEVTSRTAALARTGRTSGVGTAGPPAAP